MVIELSFQNSKKVRRRVQMLIDYISIEEMIKENPELLISIIEDEKEESEYLEKIEEIDK
jgi:hypothetical protein